jgi:hypothetical protein
MIGIILVGADLRVRPSFRAGTWVGPYKCSTSKREWYEKVQLSLAAKFFILMRVAHRHDEKGFVLLGQV